MRSRWSWTGHTERTGNGVAHEIRHWSIARVSPTYHDPNRVSVVDPDATPVVRRWRVGAMIARGKQARLLNDCAIDGLGPGRQKQRRV